MYRCALQCIVRPVPYLPLAHLVSGGVRYCLEIRLFIDWYLCEQRADDLNVFLEETFPGAGTIMICKCIKRTRSRNPECM